MRGLDPLDELAAEINRDNDQEEGNRNKENAKTEQIDKKRRRSTHKANVEPSIVLSESSDNLSRDGL